MFMKPASHASPVLCLWLCSKRSLFQSTSVQRVEFLGARSRGFLHDSDPQLNKMLLLLLWECETCETQKWKNIGACWGPELAALLSLLSLLSVLSLLSLLSYKLERSPFNKSRRSFLGVSSSPHRFTMLHTSIRGIMGGGNGQKAATARARNQAKADAEKARISQLSCKNAGISPPLRIFFDPKF